MADYITITATAIKDISGANLASGKMSIITTDADDNPIPVRVGAATAQALQQPVDWTITNGALVGTAQVPNPAVSDPSPCYFRITIEDLTKKRKTVYRQVQITDQGGGAWNFASMQTGLGLGLPRAYIVGPKGDSGELTPAQLGSYVDLQSNRYRNLFDVSRGLITNAYINYTNGAQTTLGDGTYKASGFIPVVGGGQLVISVRLGFDGTSGIAFFDANKAYISGLPGNPITAGTVINIPSNAAFTRFSVRTVDVTESTLMVVPGATLPGSYVGFGTTPQTYVDAQIASTTSTLTTNINGRMTPQRTATWRKQQMNRYTNIFDASVGLTPNAYITYTTGAQTALGDGTYKASPFMSVIPGGQIILNTAAGTDGLNGLAWYDVDQNYISGLAGSTVTANTALTAPANAMFVRIGFKTATVTESTLMIILGNTLPGSYVSFGGAPQSYVDTQIATVNTAVAAKADLGDALALSAGLLPSGANMLLQSTVTKDAGVSRANGALTTGLTNVYATDYIPVVPGQTYVIKVGQASGNSGYGIAYYNKSKVFVSAGPALPWTAGTTFTVPAGVYYIRSTGYYAAGTAELTTQMITQGSTAPTTYASNPFDAIATANTTAAAAQTTAAAKLSSPWAGKKFGVWGDSISASYSQNWQNRVIAFHPMTLPFQDARHGRRIAEWDENYNLSGGVYTRKTSTTSPASVIIGGTVGNTLVQDLTGLDLLLIELGTNTPLESFGAVNDAAGSGTTAGYIKTMLDAITTANPAMRVAWVMPYRANPAMSAMASDAQYQALRTVIIGICAMYGVAIIDEGQMSGIGPQTWGTLLRDGVHPTDTAGFSRFASVINYQMVAMGAN